MIFYIDILFYFKVKYIMNDILFSTDINSYAFRDPILFQNKIYS